MCQRSFLQLMIPLLTALSLLLAACSGGGSGGGSTTAPPLRPQLVLSLSPAQSLGQSSGFLMRRTRSLVTSTRPHSISLRTFRSTLVTCRPGSRSTTVLCNRRGRVSALLREYQCLYVYQRWNSRSGPGGDRYHQWKGNADADDRSHERDTGAGEYKYSAACSPSNGFDFRDEPKQWGASPGTRCAYYVCTSEIYD